MSPMINKYHIKSIIFHGTMFPEVIAEKKIKRNTAYIEQGHCRTYIYGWQ